MRTNHPKAIEFFCEPASSYTYLAAARIDPLAAARRVPVVWTPFLLGPIFAASGWTTSPFVLYPDKGRYMWRDIERTAARLGIPFRKPSVFPRNSVLAARVATVGVERGWGPGFVRAVLAANFADDREIAEPSVIDEILAGLALDGPATRAEAESPAFKPRLRDVTARAQAAGVFGAPTFVVGAEIFWGNDRLEEALDFAVAVGEGRGISVRSTP